ncbi:Protein of unknown function [Bacillus wiedmannii]|uniref:Uncharacterized protein n=1 Tax=Bacillus wiedmannii TaxID=1890302 RepID=A0A1C4FBN8_9BACI|nr:Protein of unknown function [Bacillus wiedmannii]SCL90391.1 Protein of unknown function [Bacillus wiedmannii]SCV19881.1 Protein of unknown function [Bacillus cereus]
MKVLRDQLRE